MKKKTVWALVSREIPYDEETQDEDTLIDIIHEELVAWDFTVDDIGFRTTLAATEGKE